MLAALVGADASAHQMKAAISRVLFNERTHSVEFMHRFYVHDAEHAVSKLAGRQVYLDDDRAAQQHFAEYVQAHFGFGFGESQPVALVNIGQEVDGKFIWVYQEYAMPKELNQLWFRFDALQEFWPGQVNQVNVEVNGKTRSLQFDNQVGWQALDF